MPPVEELVELPVPVPPDEDEPFEPVLPEELLVLPDVEGLSGLVPPLEEPAAPDELEEEFVPVAPLELELLELELLELELLVGFGGF